MNLYRTTTLKNVGASCLYLHSSEEIFIHWSKSA